MTRKISAVVLLVLFFIAQASSENIVSCRNLTKAKTVYYLIRDVSSLESCFNILDVTGYQLPDELTNYKGTKINTIKEKLR